MQTIGERLEEARKKKGISIREAAEATKIRGDYLQKFESNHFDIGLTEIYTRGFLRTYSNFLKVPADRILNDYASLGRGDVRPRQPSREVYGRMDISVATTEAGERGAAPEETVAAPEPSHANRGPTRSRTGSSLPTGPDPAVVFKYAKWAAVGVIVLLAVLILKSLFSSGRSGGTAANRATPSTSATHGPSFGLNALGNVRVTVSRAAADGVTDGEQVFAGTLRAGESRTIPRPGALFIEADRPDLLDLVINGTSYNLAKLLGPGVQRGNLPPPPSAN
jgi:cytoskeleton protein RodZ